MNRSQALKEGRINSVFHPSSAPSYLGKMIPAGGISVGREVSSDVTQPCVVLDFGHNLCPVRKTQPRPPALPQKDF